MWRARLVITLIFVTMGSCRELKIPDLRSLEEKCEKAERWLRQYYIQQSMGKELVMLGNPAEDAAMCVELQSYQNIVDHYSGGNGEFNK